MAEPVGLPYAVAIPGELEDFSILTFSSEYVREYQMKVRELPEHGFRFIQEKGRSSEGMKPYCMVRNNKTGQGVAVMLAYGGNWYIEVTPLSDGVLLRADSLPSGHRPFATVHGLPLPGALVSEFSGDWDHGAQPIVRFIRHRLKRDLGPDWPLVQYNNWFGSKGVPTEASLLEKARVAAEIGCELFTIDAGWYGGTSGGSWSEAVGDWTVKRDTFPNGIEAVADEVRRLGMKFGLWIEIERAGENTRIVKEHPEWLLRNGDEPMSERGTLDFGNPQVLAWAKAVIDGLMADYDLDYIKMDFNTDLPVDIDRFGTVEDPLYDHYRGLAELWIHMRQRYPDLIVEDCSGGSRRHDLMAAALTDTHWVSDNIRDNANLVMGFGATYLYPPESGSFWTVWPQYDYGGYKKMGDPSTVLDMQSTFTASMTGHFGLSGMIHQWDAERRRIAAERIAFYKEIRPIIRNAVVYHLTDQAAVDDPQFVQAMLYVAEELNQSLLYAFHAGDSNLPLSKTLPLPGLSPDKQYRITYPEAFALDAQIINGEALVSNGLTIQFPHPGASAIIRVEDITGQ